MENKNAKDDPIGIFDSGVGGISVLKALEKELPHENFLFYGDQKNAPYGEKTEEEVRTLSLNAYHFLKEKKVKATVIACNTATSAAAPLLREKFPEDIIIGMEPAVKPAALHSQTHHIGVLATAGTLQGELFQRTAAACARYAQVHIAVGTGLVELVEAGKADTPEARECLRELLAPLFVAGIDHLVLGCTHYPLLMPALVEVLPPTVTIVDPAPAVAQQALRLATTIVASDGEAGRVYPPVAFFSTRNTADLEAFAQRVFAFYGLLMPEGGGGG